MSATYNPAFGSYVDPRTLQLLNGANDIIHTSWGRDGRLMTLLQDAAYKDPNGRIWYVDKGHKVNGLSVPWFLWRVQPPFVGRARNASVFHDVHCDLKAFPSPEVHMMFYNIMRMDGVNRVQAFDRWLMVRLFGPRFPGK